MSSKGHGPGNGGCFPKVTMVAALMGAFILLRVLFAGEGSGASPPEQARKNLYSVMIDAGSTGSRVHAYKFHGPASRVVLDSELFEQLKPGLSAFKEDPKGGANTLIPLLDHAMNIVPVDQRGSTPVNVKATAGLRLLGAAEAEQILDATRNLLTTYPFHHDPTNGGVEIMGGLDEAYFAWVTVNYLMNNLGKPAEGTAVMLDLGGGSTQIAMSMRVGKGNIQHADTLIEKSVMGSEHSMFLHSYLGYGLMAGRDGIFNASPDGACPCIPPGSTASFSYGKNSWSASGADSGYSTCFDIAERYLRQSGGFDLASQPIPERGQPIFAMSYYFDVATDVGLISPEAQDAILKPTDFVRHAEAVCGKSAAALQTMYPAVDSDRALFLCMDLTFITALLLEGFKIERTAPLNMAKSIQFNGERVETQWTLGAAIEEVSKLN